MTLIIHCGGEVVRYSDLQQVPVPAHTRSYKPVAYTDVVDHVRERIGDRMPGMLRTEQFALGRGGKHMFAVFTLDMGSPDTGMSIGLRQSYDKSLSLGSVTGARVFVCDNLAFDGNSVRLLRKNTTNVWEDFVALFERALVGSEGFYHRVVDEFDRLKRIPCGTDRGAEIIGLAMHRDVLRAQQATEALRQWGDPQHVDFADRNLWSLYNAFTEALKKGQPSDAIGRYTDAHSFFQAVRMSEEAIYA